MHKLLIIGGTNFIGRNLVEKLLKQNRFDITLFNRGISNPDIFPQIRKINGDRNKSDINLIRNVDWDYIIDLSCYYPDSLLNTLNNVSENLKKYIFISTCSVYDNNINQSIIRNEDSPILHCSISERTNHSARTYGKRKAECERILQKSKFHYVILRPALVYGEYDNTDRFYYWLYQVKKNKKVLIPNKGGNFLSITYVKDLIDTILKVIDKEKSSDVYNVTTFPKTTIKKIIDCACGILNTQPTLINATSDFLKSKQIHQWTDLPLWLDCDYFTYNNIRLLKDIDVHFTEFKKTVTDTIKYYNKLGWPKPKFGITNEEKNKLIKSLKR